MFVGFDCWFCLLVVVGLGYGLPSRAFVVCLLSDLLWWLARLIYLFGLLVGCFGFTVCCVVLDLWAFFVWVLLVDCFLFIVIIYLLEFVLV